MIRDQSRDERSGAGRVRHVAGWLLRLVVGFGFIAGGVGVLLDTVQRSSAVAPPFRSHPSLGFLLGGILVLAGCTALAMRASNLFWGTVLGPAWFAHSTLRGRRKPPCDRLKDRSK